MLYTAFSLFSLFVVLLVALVCGSTHIVESHRCIIVSYKTNETKMNIEVLLKNEVLCSNRNHLFIHLLGV